MNILLIDKRVSRYEDIVAAIDPALAVSIVFDYFEDTFETLKVRIRDLAVSNTNATPNSSVGLVQHNYRAPMFSMLASSQQCIVARAEAQDPELATWTQFKEFVVWCKSEFSVTHFDLMACALYSNNNWKYVIDTLATQTGITIRASTDNTGSATLGGNWFLESHTGVNLKGVYFTELINEYKGLLFLEPYNRKYPTKSFAVGNAIVWPWAITISDVVAIYFTDYAVAALKPDGSVLNTYGNVVVSSGVIAVYSTYETFAALKSDGSVISWYDPGDGSPVSVMSFSNIGAVAVYSTATAFAALKSDGSVVAWGNVDYGGTDPGIISGVVSIYSTYGAFAALKSDGSVQAWGDSGQGGEAPTTVTAANSGVVTVYSTGLAFVALKSDGSVQAWGDFGYGGTAPSTVTAANSGVVSIYSAQLAFAALKSDGSVVAWGDPYSGGTTPETGVSSGVVAVYSNSSAFAALKSDGSIVAWGSELQGGTAPTTVTSANSGVVAVYSTDGGAFAALKSNGSLVVWGYDLYGGTAGSAASLSLISGVVAVYSVYDTFAALKNDGSIVAWNAFGSSASEAPSTVTNANSGVVAVYSSNSTFAALKTTATTFDLSASYYTGMDRYTILRKKENRRRVNLTALNNNVFTLSNASDIKIFNPTIPAGKTFGIIVPDYTASSYSITSTATIPSGSGNFIVACDDSEPVTISGTTYVNYGSYVYKRETDNTYTKTTSATINGTIYTLYGGDSVNSSGIALISIELVVMQSESTLSSFAFTVPTTKNYGNEPFTITAPTTNSGGAITYSSNSPSIATIDAITGVIALVGVGDVTFTAMQAETVEYLYSTVTSNVLRVSLGATSLTAFSVIESKTYGDASFNIAAPTSNRAGAFAYSSNTSGVATIDASSGLITLQSAGTVTFTASQGATTQYGAGTITTNVLTVSLGTPTLSALLVPTLKGYGDVPFGITAPAPTSKSSGAITYSSDTPSVATIDESTGVITVVFPGTVTFTASQAAVPGEYVAAAAVTSGVLTVTLSEQTVAPGTSFADSDLSGVSLAGTTLIGVSFSGATLTGADFLGATVTGANFTNANIVGATNLPAFSTTQKLQLLRNTNNVGIDSVQISTPLSGAEINAAITVPVPDIAGATFIVKAPAYNSSNEKVVTVSAGDITDHTSIYIPLNSGETVIVNGAAYTFDGTNVLDSNSSIVTTLSVLGVPFRIYVGSIILLNITLMTPTISAFVVASSKMLGDAAFAITMRPTSNSSGVITYTSNRPSVATIDASGNHITLQSAGAVTFTASQAEVPEAYAAITVTSNIMSVRNAQTRAPAPMNRWFSTNNAPRASASAASDRISALRARALYRDTMNAAAQGGYKVVGGDTGPRTVVYSGPVRVDGKCLGEGISGTTGGIDLTAVPSECVAYYIRSAASYRDLLDVTRGIYAGHSETHPDAASALKVPATPPANSDWVKLITPQGDPAVAANRLALNGASTSDALLLLSPPPQPQPQNNNNNAAYDAALAAAPDPLKCIQYLPNQQLSITYGGAGCLI